MEQFCRIHSLRSVTTCGEEELALRDSALILLPGTPRLGRPRVWGVREVVAPGHSDFVPCAASPRFHQ